MNQMRLPVKLSSSITGYPYKERLPLAVLFLCVTAWELRTVWPYAHADGYVSIGALFLAVLCKRRDRPFWSFMGIATGAVLVVVLPLLNSPQGAYFAGGLVIMVVTAWLIRKL